MGVLKRPEEIFTFVLAGDTEIRLGGSEGDFFRLTEELEVTLPPVSEQALKPDWVRFVADVDEMRRADIFLPTEVLLRQAREMARSVIPNTRNSIRVYLAAHAVLVYVEGFGRRDVGEHLDSVSFY